MHPLQWNTTSKFEGRDLKNGQLTLEKPVYEHSRISIQTSVRDSDVGNYVCTVNGGSLSVVYNAATLAVNGMFLCVASYQR